LNGTFPGKSWKKGFLSRGNPGIWSFQVLEKAFECLYEPWTEWSIVRGIPFPTN